jgi:hypothetical protein
MTSCFLSSTLCCCLCPAIIHMQTCSTCLWPARAQPPAWLSPGFIESTCSLRMRVGAGLLGIRAVVMTAGGRREAGR